MYEFCFLKSFGKISLKFREMNWENTKIIYVKILVYLFVYILFLFVREIFHEKDS